MIYIKNNNTKPYFNLALEEYLLKNTEEEYFMLWRDEPCILVGKNQNTLSEINLDYVKENNIGIVRRLTGGGTVFNDLGNLNFTFIINDKKSFTDFEKFVQPILEILKQLGINAEFSGRNDMLIDGRKFSGNAQCKYKDRVMHHGTLLFSSNMKNVSEALLSKPIKFSDKSVKSVKSRVTNISEHLREPLSVIEFNDLIFKYIAKNNPIKDSFNEEELKAINKLVKDKYETWQWNYGESPKYSFKNEKKFKGGLVELMLEVDKGIIKNIKIYGDFFGQKDIEHIEKALIGVEHQEENVKEVLNKFNIDEYLFNIKMHELLELMF